MQCVGDAACGFECLSFRRIDDVGAKLPAVAKRGFDQRAQMRVVDDDIGETGRDELFDVPRNQRLAADGERALYRFALSSAGIEILHGKAAVVLSP